jgi:peptidoglycan hydrolase-like protein with peptidoglycan-binding domain
MKKIILTETQLKRIVDKVLNEQTNLTQKPVGKVYSDPKNPFVQLPNRDMGIPYYTKDGNGGLWIKNLQKVLIRLGYLKLTKGPTGFMGDWTKKAIIKAAGKYNSGIVTNLSSGIPKTFYEQLINLKPGQ